MFYPASRLQCPRFDVLHPPAAVSYWSGHHNYNVVSHWSVLRLPYAVVPYWSVYHTPSCLIGAFTIRRRALLERLPYAVVPYWSIYHTPSCLIGAFTIRRRALLEDLPYAALMGFKRVEIILRLYS